jgi:hypothetical protein
VGVRLGAVLEVEAADTSARALRRLSEMVNGDPDAGPDDPAAP